MDWLLNWNEMQSSHWQNWIMITKDYHEDLEYCTYV